MVIEVVVIVFIVSISPSLILAHTITNSATEANINTISATRTSPVTQYNGGVLLIGSISIKNDTLDEPAPPAKRKNEVNTPTSNENITSTVNRSETPQSDLNINKTILHAINILNFVINNEQIQSPPSKVKSPSWASSNSATIDSESETSIGNLEELNHLGANEDDGGSQQSVGEKTTTDVLAYGFNVPTG
jgi:hypothetical protein